MDKVILERMKEDIRAVNLGTMLMSKGKVYFIIDEKQELLKIMWSNEDINIIGELTKKKPDLKKVLKHFWHNYTETEEGLKWEGVIAFTMYHILLWSINNIKTLKSFFKNIRFN